MCHEQTGKVLAGANVNGMKLEAFTRYYAPSKEVGVVEEQRYALWVRRLLAHGGADLIRQMQVD